MLPTLEYLNNCFSYDAETGLLYWRPRPQAHFKSRRAWKAWTARYSGKQVGYVNNSGRLSVKLDGRAHLQHRIIWAILKRLDMVDLPKEIDHEDMNPLNNREINLRAATKNQNQHNRRAYSNNKSGFKGVSWHKKTEKWVAQIKVDGRKIHLGLFGDPAEAHERYKIAANENHKNFARSA